MQINQVRHDRIIQMRFREGTLTPTRYLKSLVNLGEQNERNRYHLVD